MADWTPTLVLIGVIVTALFSGGGIVALIRLRHDKKMGVAVQEVTEDDAEAKRWQAIIETQTKALLEPMQKRLSDVEASLEKLEAELATSRRKYWLAISYIRTLLTWIGRHMPDDLDTTAIPEPASMLVDDI